MYYFIMAISIALTITMILFTVFYSFVVVKFYKKLWEDKTLIDDYIKQRYGLSTHTYVKKHKGGEKDV